MGVKVPQQNNGSPREGHYLAPLTETPRRPGTPHYCSANRPKRQSETYPQPKGAGMRPSHPLGSTPTQANLHQPAASPRGPLQSRRESSPSQGDGFQSPRCAWRRARLFLVDISRTPAQAQAPSPAAR
ncbi:hypothetical protein CHARACLAT_024698 [Characodon lateralis]|uniref:Uncharacterized protein n=1 Tax=Characodon lateralis TaxID=208331 RepID=A0ABU7DAF3_9TELE|nr:hypothetical protein [Characodon lateralis]